MGSGLAPRFGEVLGRARGLTRGKLAQPQAPSVLTLEGPVVHRGCEVQPAPSVPDRGGATEVRLGEGFHKEGRAEGVVVLSVLAGAAGTSSVDQRGHVSSGAALDLGQVEVEMLAPPAVPPLIGDFEKGLEASPGSVVVAVPHKAERLADGYRIRTKALVVVSGAERHGSGEEIVRPLSGEARHAG